MGGQLVTYLDHHLHRLHQKLQDELFDPLLVQQSCYSHHLELTLKHLHIHARYLHHRIIILCLQKELPLLIQIQIKDPELLPEDQIRVSPTVRRAFPELSYKVNENELQKLEFTIPNFDEITNTLNDGEIPPALEFFNGGPSLRFEQIINNLGIYQDS